MKKNRIRLTESQLHHIIKESVKRILEENEDYYYDDIDNGFNGDVDKQRDYSWDCFENRDGWMEDFVDEDGKIFTTKRNRTDYDKNYVIDDIIDERNGRDRGFRENNDNGAKNSNGYFISYKW